MANSGGALWAGFAAAHPALCLCRMATKGGLRRMAATPGYWGMTISESDGESMKSKGASEPVTPERLRGWITPLMARVTALICRPGQLLYTLRVEVQRRVAVVVLSAGWAYKHGVLTDERSRMAVIPALGFGVVAHFLSLRAA